VNLPAELKKVREEYGKIAEQFSKIENIRLDAEQIVRDLYRPERQRDTRDRGMER